MRGGKFVLIAQLTFILTILQHFPLTTIVSSLVQQVLAQTTETRNEEAEVILQEQGVLGDSEDARADGYLFDIYPFEGSAGQSVTITVESEEFDTRVGLLDSQGQKIAQNNNISHNNTNSAITITLSRNDVYRVVILGFDPKSRGKYNLIVREATATEIRKAEADRILKQGKKHFQAGQLLEAVQSWEQALTIYREIVDKQGEANSLNSLGVGYSSLGQYQKAIEFHTLSLDTAKEIGYKRGEASALNNLGGVYEDLGQYQKAIEFHTLSLAIERELGNRQGEGIALSNLGLAYNHLQQYTQSEKTLLEAIEVMESLRFEFTDTNDEISLSDTQAASYRLLQEALVAQNKTNKALEIAERGRARVFVKLLALRLSENSDNKSTDTTDTVSTKSHKIEQIKQIASEQNATIIEYSIIFDALYIWVVKPTGEVAFRQVNPEPDISLKDFVPEIRRTLDSRNPASISPTEQLTFAKGDLVRRNDEPDYVYEVVEVDTENGFLTLRIPNGTPLPEPVPMTEVYKVESSRSNNAKLQQLHKILINPIADLLPTNPEARVIFIPQGELFLIPFPALQDGSGKYLIEKHTIGTAPAIQVLDLTRSLRQRNGTQPNRNVLVVGNPTMPKYSFVPGEPPQSLASLPGSEKEAFNIAQLYNTRPLIGAQATKAAIKSQLSNARIIHLATHGILNEVNALESAIALAPSSNDNGLLTANEILDLKLNAELFVLSACNTGKGRITGDGVIGLSRSLFIAGVPSVLVSLWTVDDVSTAELMKEFYQNLQQGMDKAQALRQAMLEMMDKYPQPRNWAAFTLIGEAE